MNNGFLSATRLWFIRLVIVLFYLFLISSLLYAPQVYEYFFDRSNSVTLYTFRQVFDEDIFEEFEKQTGIHVQVTYFDTNEEMLARFRISRGVGYDVVVPSDYMVELLIREGLLKNVDKTKLTNYKQLDRRLMGLFYDPVNQYSVPVCWIPYGIGFNRKDFNLDNNVSWDIVFKKEALEAAALKKNQGYRVSAINHPTDMVFLSAIYLFGSVRSITDAKMEKIKELLINQKPNVEAYVEAGAKYLLLAGIVPVAVLPSARMKEMGDIKNFGFVIPKEGSLVDILNLGILKTSKNVDAAHKLIDFLISKENGAHNFEKIACNPANKESYGLIRPEYSKDKAYFPDDEMFKRLKILNNELPPSLLEKVWFLVKSA